MRIWKMVRSDMSQRPHVHSAAQVSKTKGVETLETLGKDFARTVHQRKGKVVYVNLTQPSKEWNRQVLGVPMNPLIRSAKYLMV